MEPHAVWGGAGQLPYSCRPPPLLDDPCPGPQEAGGTAYCCDAAAAALQV